MQHLPIDDILPQLIQTLKEAPCVILEAPPGAGKSTRVPPALLDAGFCDQGQIWMLEPRRVAARAVASRIADERRQPLGQQVGYAVRFDRKASAKTQLLVVTEGLLLRRLLDDPFLEGIDCVILDEFHERSIDVDLCLAMLKEVLTIRDDLRVVVMSATLQSQALAQYMDAPVISSKGRMFDVEAHFLDQPTQDIVRSAMDATTTAIASDDGDVLVFMPGRRTIEQTIHGLRARLDPAVACLPLHGSLSLNEQMQAITPSNQQRVIVSTNIAETSLTVQGITTVVDSGKVKQLIASNAGIDQLVLGEISQASAKQRAGRAGRVQAGRVFKLWTRAQDQFLPEYDIPSILRTDVTAALLNVLAWSSNDPMAFDWYEAPSAQVIERTMSLLRQLRACDQWTLTSHGQALAALPIHPRLGQLIVEGYRLGVEEDAILAAALLSEDALDMWHIPNTQTVCELERVMQKARQAGIPGRIKQSVKQLRHLGRALDVSPAKADVPHAQRFQRALMRAYPDRICQHRQEDRYIMGGQQPVLLARQSRLMRAPWIVAISLHGKAQDRTQSGTTTRALVRVGSVIERDWLEADFAERWDDHTQVHFDERLGKVSALAQRRFDQVVVDERPLSLKQTDVDEAQVASILAQALSADVHKPFKFSKEESQLLDRIAFLSHWMPELQLPVLSRYPPDGGRGARTMSLFEQWCWGKRGFDELKRQGIGALLNQSLTHAQRQALSEHAPATFEIPSGSNMRLDYSDPESPVLAARIQELFGLLTTPTVAGGKVNVTMHLLAPNYRPAQVTQDLGSFWQNTYADVRKELRARYPKHDWPEDPMQAKAKRRRR